MPLSRLENFLKNVQGNVIYVNPEELDATDDVANTGNSRTRPFKTIQRALLESARFSYQLGQDNDKFDKTTILVSPGVHYVDNRPGYKIDTSGNITDVNGTAKTISEFSIGSKFDLQDPSNILYTFNSVDGGVILPRGTSIVGQDLRKTKIRPKYIPQPANASIPNTAIFKVTGGCFFYGFTFFDGDPADRVYRDFTANVYNPNYSHHKLTCFEFADGITPVGSTGNTDLDMFYAKLTRAYGTNSGRALPNYPSNTDFQQVIDETRIVGPISQIGVLEIEDIYSGTNATDSTATKIVTVITKEKHSLNAGTAVLISGVNSLGNNGGEYDGTHVVAQVLNDTSFTYSVEVAPATTALPNLTGISPTVVPESDSVNSSSPYVFNCSIRSVFGMNGLHADGAKATGFKSMVAAQFTGIGLQKDDQAFVKYNTTSGAYEDQTALGTSVILHNDSNARYKNEYENFHIKASNKAALQLVSTFAIGYAKHFVCDTGADASITNSNSNFGALAFESDGYRSDAFTKDDKGYITSIVPPQKNTAEDTNFNWLQIATGLTTTTAGDTKLFLSGYTNKGNVPSDKASNFTVGARVGDQLTCVIAGTAYSADILMPTPQIPDNGVSAQKIARVGESAGISSIASNIFTLQGFHQFSAGESVKVLSDNGALPDGLEHNKEYFVVTAGINTHQVKLATSKNNALAGNAVSGINNLGGKLQIISTVEGKKSGDIGHPIQWDSAANGWYIKVDSGSGLYNAVNINALSLQPDTAATTISRRLDSRKDLEKIYRLRYSIPESSVLAAPPVNGFSIEDSGSAIDDNKFRNDNAALTSGTDLRTNNAIITASWSSNVGIITTKNPHNLKVNQVIELKRLRTSNNTSGADNSGYNRVYSVTQVNDRKTFRIGLSTDPGAVTKITTIPYTQVDETVVGSGRTFSPYFVRKDYGNSYQIFNQEVVQGFKKDSQDGVYDLTMLGYFSTPTVSPFNTVGNKFAQNVNDLKPIVSRNNPDDDPGPTVSYALRDKIGQVKSNDVSKSVTREGIYNFIDNAGIGIGLTAGVVSSPDLKLDTAESHGFNGIESVGNITGGTQYGTNSGSAEFYYSVDLTGGTGEGATADVTVAASSVISAVDIVDAGSGYSVGDVLTVQGVPFHTPGSHCNVTITAIDNSITDVVQVVGFGSTAFDGVHKVLAVDSKSRFTFRGSSLGDWSTPGGFFYHVGISTGVQDIKHDHITGIATVTLYQDIGLRRGDMITINDANSQYNGTHVVEDRVGYGASLSVKIGKSASALPLFSGSSAYAHDAGISMRAHGQNVPIYGGATTVITSSMSGTTTNIALQKKAMFRRGDFIQIEDEILRIANKACTTCIRGLFGTNSIDHPQSSAARKIKIISTENRRNSIIRASGHTFEYLGYGPGNYSTSLPQTQDRILDDDEQLVAQALQKNGGTVVYTGMNDKGEYYIGRKKIDAITGEESSTIKNLDTTPVAVLPESIVFNDLIVKDNLTSQNETEVVDLKLKGNRAGDIGSQVLLGINASEPSSSTDNIIFATTQDKGGYLGWVRTTDSGSPWQRFGPISYEAGSEHYTFDKLALGQTNVSIGGDVLSATGNITVTGNAKITGIGTIGSAVLDSAKVTDLTTGRVVVAGADGELEDSSSLRFSGATLTANTLSVTNDATLGDGTGDTTTVSGTLNVFGTTNSTTKDSGALVVKDGGLGVEGNIHAGGNVHATNLNATASTVTGTATADTFVGKGIIPIGGIIMWSGTDGNVPANWSLCNGSGGTPNLVDRFIVGRGSAYGSGATGGSKDAVVVDHNHPYSTTTGSEGDHNHAFKASNRAGDSDAWSNTNKGFIGDLDSAAFTQAADTNKIYDNGSHQHSVSGTTDSIGSSGSDKNLPPYYALAYIMRMS